MKAIICGANGAMGKLIDQILGDQTVGRVSIDGENYLAVTNVGTRLTVSGHHITVEPWIMDLAGDLYGKTITLEFHAFLRPERKFDSLEALKAAIEENARQTREYFET